MLTQERLKELLSYDPETGIFVRNTTIQSYQKGSIAGSIKLFSGRPYVSICIDRKYYLAHRLAWMYVYGEMPSGCVDHIDGKGANNRIENLRDVPFSENMKNKRKSNSKPFGIYFSKTSKRFIARITVDKKMIYLGSFVEYEDAVLSRRNAEKKYGFHSNHGVGRNDSYS